MSVLPFRILAAFAVVLLIEVAIGILLAEGAVRRPFQSNLQQLDNPQIETRGVDNTLLSGKFFRPRLQNGACVIILHGIGDSSRGAAGFSNFLLEKGYKVLTPDSRGHGGSEGQFVTYGLLEADDVIHWAKEISPDCPNGIYGLGESFGAAVLIQAAAKQHQFKAIVAESCFASFRTVALDRVSQRLPFPTYASRFLAEPIVASGIAYVNFRYGFDLVKASPEIEIQRAHIPILLIHGLSDNETPPEHSRVLASKSLYAQLWLVPGAKHVGAMAADPAEFRKRVLAGFKRTKIIIHS